ncbi:MAG: hypothetical protein K2X94_00795 [Amoebophilaceae bacterium]|nr:hypothetical protein [Amoebophilaceae bacterium]
MVTKVLKSGLMLAMGVGLFACNGDNSAGSTSNNSTTTLTLNADKTMTTLQANQKYTVVVEDMNNKTIDSVAAVFTNSANAYTDTLQVHGINPNKLYIIKIYAGQGLVAGSIFDPVNTIGAPNVVTFDVAMLAAVIGQDVARVNGDSIYTSKVKMSMAFLHRTVNYDEPYGISAKVVEYGLENGVTTNYNSFLQKLAPAVSKTNFLYLKGAARANFLVHNLNAPKNNLKSLNSSSYSVKSIAVAGSDIATSIINCLPGGMAVTGSIKALVTLFTGSDDTGVTMNDLSSAISEVQSTLEDGFGNVETGINMINNLIYTSSAATQYANFDTYIANLNGTATYYSDIRNTYAADSTSTIDDILDVYLSENPTDTSFSNFTSLNTLIENMQSTYTYSAYISNSKVLNSLSNAMYGTAIPTNTYDGSDVISLRYYYTLARYDIALKISLGLETAYDVDKLALYLKYKSKYKDQFKSKIAFYSTTFTSTNYESNLVVLHNNYESMVTSAVTIVSNPDLTVSPVKDIEPYTTESSTLNCSYTSWTGTTLSGICYNGAAAAGSAMLESSTLTFTDTGGNTESALCTASTNALNGKIVNNYGHLGCASAVDTTVGFGANTNFSEFGNNAVLASSVTDKAFWVSKINSNYLDVKIVAGLHVYSYQESNSATVSLESSATSSLSESLNVYRVTIPQGVTSPSLMAEFLLGRQADDSRSSYILRVYAGGITSSTDNGNYAYTVLYPIASRQGLTTSGGEQSLFSAPPTGAENYLDTIIGMDLQLGTLADPALFRPAKGARVFAYRDLLGTGYDSIALNTCDYGQTTARSSSNTNEVCVYVDPTWHHANGVIGTGMNTTTGQYLTVSGNIEISLPLGDGHWFQTTKTSTIAGIHEVDANNRTTRATYLSFSIDGGYVPPYAALVLGLPLAGANPNWVYPQLRCLAGQTNCVNSTSGGNCIKYTGDSLNRQYELNVSDTGAYTISFGGGSGSSCSFD